MEQILNVCAYSYKARWLFCENYGQENKTDARKVCKVMNYVRFSRCVESNYASLLKENKVTMNLGYSNTILVASNGSENI